jgi:RNA polymerase sigma-70 factor (ECF subfamily)
VRQPWIGGGRLTVDVEIAITGTTTHVHAATTDEFEVLYRQHAPRLFALACRMAGSRDRAEDLLQDIFLQAFRKLDTFKGQAAIGTWLYRLALNLCVDYVRSRAVRVGHVTESLDREDAPPQPAPPASHPLTRLALDRAIEQLPDGCRAAFVLHDVEGFDHAEVARLLGIAEGTSKSQVFKARMKLRALLQA